MAGIRPSRAPAQSEERIRASTPPAATTETLVHALQDIERRVAAIDSRATEGKRDTALATALLLRTSIEHAIQLLGALRQLDEADSDADTSFDLDLGAPHATAPRAPCLADICFAGTFELRSVAEQLSGVRDHDDALVAIEAAQGKLARGVRAIREMAQALGPVATESLYPRSAIASALAVRRLYHQFRRSLRRPADPSLPAVLVALRYAAGALASIASDSAYDQVRAADRVLLRRLRERVLHWGTQPDKRADVGVELLEDARTCSDLLRGINRRQELRIYDSDLAGQLVRNVSLDEGALREALETLLGRDDRLDDAIEAWCVDPTPRTMAVVRELLGELVAL